MVDFGSVTSSFNENENTLYGLYYNTNQRMSFSMIGFELLPANSVIKFAPSTILHVLRSPHFLRNLFTNSTTGFYVYSLLFVHVSALPLAFTFIPYYLFTFLHIICSRSRFCTSLLVCKTKVEEI